MTQTTAAKRITLATVKAFIRRQATAGNLYFKEKSSFSGMTDCVEQTKGAEFTPATFDPNARNFGYCHGVDGAWFVGSSRDHLDPFEDDQFFGFYVYNCCGSFYLAAKK